jgi:hypothetical protein
VQPTTGEVTLTPAPPCPKAPWWDGTTTAFGTNISTRDKNYETAVAELDATFGRLGAVRVFDPGLPPATAWERRGPLLEGRRVVYSFRAPPAEILAGTHDARLLHFFESTPDGVDLFWSYFHEVEPHIDAGTFTADTYKRAFRHVVDLAQGLCRPNLYPTLILTGYTTEVGSGRQWRTYHPGDDYVSVLGWDPYNSASEQPTEYAPPEELYGGVVAASQETGKPFGIAETGSRLIPTDPTGRGRARWLTDVARYLEEQGAVFVTYYSSVGVSGADYRLLDPPSIAAWRRVAGPR